MPNRIPPSCADVLAALRVPKTAWAWLAVGALLAAPPVRAETVEGFTEPYREVHLAAAEPGVITQINVAEGETVDQGKVLAVLDLEVLDASLDVARSRAQARGRLDAALAELRLRENRLEKLRGLHERGHSTAGELDKAEADAAVARAGVQAAQEEREICRLECKRIEAQIERRKIRSPMAAVVARVHKEVGEGILANDPAVVTLIRLDSLRIRFPVPGPQAGGASVGQAVRLHFPETGQKAQGRVEAVAPVTDAKSGTVEVTVVLENPDRLFRSGMRCILALEPAGTKGPEAGNLAWSADKPDR
jgi:RND family efflux transporter MFP subunit